MIEVNVVDILSSLNILHTIKGHKAWACCPFHSEKSASFSIELEEPYRFRCFGCRDKGNIFSLYFRKTNKSLLKSLGVTDTNSYQFTESLKERRRVFTEKKEKKIHNIYGEMFPVTTSTEVLNYFAERSEEGVSQAFIDYFEIKFCIKLEINRHEPWLSKDDSGTFFYNRVCVPIYENGILVSLEGRSFNDKEPKVLYPKNSKVDTLFNIDRLDRTKPLYVVEGIFDLVALFNLGYRNITCIIGAGLTPRQILMLNEFAEIHYFPDNDDVGIAVLKVLDEELNKDFYVHFVPEHRKDPGKCTVVDMQVALQKGQLYVDYIFKEVDPIPKEEVYW